MSVAQNSALTRHVRVSGMSLIQLMLLIALLASLALVRLTGVKGDRQAQQLALTLAQNEHLTLAMRAYYSQHGYWPDGDPATQGSCVQALTVLQSDQGVYLRGLTHNGFGSQWQFRCAENDGASLFVRQFVSHAELPSALRYLYRARTLEYVDLTEVSSASIEIEHEILPTDSASRRLFFRVPFGNRVVQRIEATAASALDATQAVSAVSQTAAELTDLRAEQAFLERPEQCLNTDRVQLSVQSTAICWQQTQIDANNWQRTLTLPVTFIVARPRRSSQLSQESNQSLARVPTAGSQIAGQLNISINRSLRPAGIAYQVERCALRALGALRCRDDLDDFHGWRVSLQSQFSYRYVLRYHLSSDTVDRQFTRVLERAASAASQTIADQLFNETVLLARLQLRQLDWSNQTVQLNEPPIARPALAQCNQPIRLHGLPGYPSPPDIQPPNPLLQAVVSCSSYSSGS